MLRVAVLGVEYQIHQNTALNSTPKCLDCDKIGLPGYTHKIIWEAIMLTRSWQADCEGRRYMFNVFEPQSCKGALGSQSHRPIYDHGAQPIRMCLTFRREKDQRARRKKTSWHTVSRKEPTHNSTHDPSLELNQGHSGERRVVYALVTDATQVTHVREGGFKRVSLQIRWNTKKDVMRHGTVFHEFSIFTRTVKNKCQESTHVSLLHQKDLIE